MARILFLTQVLPYPLDAGPKVRAYYMLRHVASRHEVTLVSFVRPDDKPEYVEHLRQLVHAVHTVPMHRSMPLNLRAAATSLLDGRPIMIARDAMPAMGDLLRRLTAEKRFDLIHADQLSMAHWGQVAARGGGRGEWGGQEARRPATLLDEHNAIYRLTERMADEAHGLRRVLLRREARVFRRYEAAMLAAYDGLLAVTEEDRRLLLALFDEPARARQAAKLTVIPICIDPTRVHVARPAAPLPPWQNGTPPQASDPSQPRTPALPQFRTSSILHLGTMFWPPNVAGVLWFARDVMPLIWARLPDARFVVAGKNPPAEIQALAADPRIEVTGYVADPLPILEAADAFVVPLFSGGGMRVKILDGWLWGLPIVSTRLGAEGIDLGDGETILLADDAPAFAEATYRVLTDPALNTRLRSQGRAWVEAAYDWRNVYAGVDAIYEPLLEDSGGAHHKDTENTKDRCAIITRTAIGSRTRRRRRC
jgi:glycosyltransferase involved in cell wall biosynthesis